MHEETIGMLVTEEMSILSKPMLIPNYLWNKTNTDIHGWWLFLEHKYLFKIFLMKGQYSYNYFTTNT